MGCRSKVVMSSKIIHADFLIIGAGAIGLFLAVRLKEKYNDCTILVRI